MAKRVRVAARASNCVAAESIRDALASFDELRADRVAREPVLVACRRHLQEQRRCIENRLKLMTDARTAAPNARFELLRDIGNCNEPRDRFWELARSAAMAATMARCDEVHRLYNGAAVIDPSLHHVVFEADPEIMRCVRERLATEPRP